MVVEFFLIVLLFACVFLALGCVVLKDSNVHLRNSLDRVYDTERGLNKRIYMCLSEIKGLRSELAAYQGEINRLRESLLDARCRLEMIDDEVGFWVDDKMNVRWGVHPRTGDGCSLSSELVEEGVVDYV